MLQSIAIILTTPVGSRVMRRDFGSEIPDLIDRPMMPRVILAVYAAAANALDRWEPRFRLTHAQVDETSPQGVLRLMLVGTYYPRGHHGDFSEAIEGRTAIIGFNR